MFNVVRPTTPPACLIQKKYNSEEVVDTLHAIFHGKCYLCEQDELTSPEIEHLDPHEGDDVKKYDWRNLYYSCGRCNSIKSNTHKNIIDCCNTSIDIFRAIQCIMPSTPNAPVSVKDMGMKNIITLDTIHLLDRCYNDAGTPLRGITRAALMEKMFVYFYEFLSYRFTLKDKRSGKTEKDIAKERLLAMLDIKFPFSVFWRWHVLDDSFLRTELQSNINF